MTTPTFREEPIDSLSFSPQTRPETQLHVDRNLLIGRFRSFIDHFSFVRGERIERNFLSALPLLAPRWIIQAGSLPEAN